MPGYRVRKRDDKYEVLYPGGKVRCRVDDGELAYEIATELMSCLLYTSPSPRD